MMKTGALIRLLEADGWYLVRQKGSHALYRHATKPGRLVVPMHGGKDLATGTVHAILKQAGLKP